MADLAEMLRGALPPPRPDPPLPEGVPAAVVLPLLEAPEPALLFTRRTDDLRHHRGEVSFPGGARHDEDPDLLTTALRETEEELGIPASAHDVLGRLVPMQAGVSGYAVVPFVAHLGERPELRPNPMEVAEVLELPLELLAAVERLERVVWEGGSYDTYVYEVNGQVVWGLTGRILHHLLRTLEREGWTWTM
ncbi:MAG TPA: CoA pyrophosphatase [Actinomycetota bacterium]